MEEAKAHVFPCWTMVVVEGEDEVNMFNLVLNKYMDGENLMLLS